MACPNVIINRTKFAFTASNSDLKHWKELKGGGDTKGCTETELGRQRVSSPYVLINKTIFAFYSIKIRLETETSYLQVPTFCPPT